MVTRKTFQILTVFTLSLALIGTMGCGGRSTDEDGGYDAGHDGNNGGDAVTIYAIQNEQEANHPAVDSNVVVKGVVVSTPMDDDSDPDGFWVQEIAGGMYSGLYVFLGSLDVTVAQGDKVDIEGVYEERYGQTQIAATSVTVVGTETVPAPAVVTPSDVFDNGANAEAYEGVIIQMQNVYVSSAMIPGNDGNDHGDFGIKATGSDDEVIVTVTFQDYYDYTRTANDNFNEATGVLEYTFDHFRLAPRGCNDLIRDTGDPVCAVAECPAAGTVVTIDQLQNEQHASYIPRGCDIQIEGAIVTTPVFKTGSTTLTDNFYVQAPAGGPFSGIYIRGNDDSSGVGMGDEVTIRGTVEEYYEKTRLEATTITATGSGTIPDPVVVTPEEVNNEGSLRESYEGVLVKLEDVMVTQAAFMGTDGNDHGDFLVAALADLETEQVIGWDFQYAYSCPPEEEDVCDHGNDDQRTEGDQFESITGVLDYSYDNFRVQPRMDADLVPKEVDPNDTDGDGVENAADNCPDDYNPNQENDGDTDTVGDICDNCPAVDNDAQVDTDNDTVGDLCDNCMDDANTDQANLDDDEFGDLCDPDVDGDGIDDDGDDSGTAGDAPCTGGVTADCDDNCPRIENADQADSDGDGIGDLCEGSDHILLTEICVQPTGNEFVEIHNPGNAAVDLSDYYLWDATSHPDTEYWLIATLSSVGSTDFVVRFPDGASIDPGAYMTISVTAAADFATNLGVEPDFAVKGDGTGNTLDMRQPFSGAVGGSAGLSNNGEVVVLFHWDGATDLVQDIDYVVWGDKNEGSDKTGVTVGSGTYADDTAIADQEALDGHEGSPTEPDGWQSMQRSDLMEGNETLSGGNGISGHDETSEDFSNTWTVAYPTPGAATE